MSNFNKANIINEELIKEIDYNTLEKCELIEILKMYEIKIMKYKENLIDHLNNEKLYLTLLKEAQEYKVLTKNTIKELKAKVSEVEIKNNKLNKQHTALKNSKLGKITTEYWKFKKKIKN